MMNSTVIDVTGTAPLSHEEAMPLQAVELERTVELLGTFSESDWSAQTECPDWDVRMMYLHVLGACDAAASIKQSVHQMVTAKRFQRSHGGPLEAALSSVQVRERLELSPADLVQRMTEVAPVTVRKRTKLPSLVRRTKMKIDGPVIESWAYGYLVDTIYLRDMWMHRVDACRATGREMVLSADHDGCIVADVVAEWARRHDQPFSLTLTGPAGGTFTSSGSDSATGPIPDPDVLELDAVEFCRMLGGRADGEGLLSTIVPF